MVRVMNLRRIPRVKRLMRELMREGWAPPPLIKVSEWADDYRTLSQESSAEPGRWKTSRAEYQREIMDAVNDPDIDTVVAMLSSQTGKSEVLLNTIGSFIDMDPGPMLLIQPTIDMAQAFSKERITPMIRDTKILTERVADNKSRDSNNTIQMKVFPGGFLAMGGANSPAGLASRPIRFLFGDEIDRYPFSAGKEGSPLALAARRTTTFWNRKKIYTSTPTIKGASNIETEYEKGTQERWCIECPDCKEHQYLSVDGMAYEKEKDKKGSVTVSDIKFTCQSCGCLNTETAWKSMPGKWIAGNPGVKGTRSFHTNAFVSPWASWGLILKEWEEAQGDSNLEQVVVNTLFGQTYEEKGEISNEDFLINRQEDYEKDTLPAGVLMLTCGVDVQNDRLEYEIVGWGVGEESWGIEYGRIIGKPDQEIVWTDLENVIFKSFKHASNRSLSIACTFVDSGGGYTSHVYEFTKKHEDKYVFSIKGQGGPGIDLIHRLYRSKRVNAAVFILGVDDGKGTIISRLKIEKEGPKYCHFPKGRGYNQIYFKGLISERMEHKKSGGTYKTSWLQVRARNEPFDLRNYAYAAMKLRKPNFESLNKIINSTPESNDKNKDNPSVQQKPKRKKRAASRGVVV